MDIFLLCLVTLVAGYWIFTKIQEWRDQPPGPWGLPVVGYLPFLDARKPYETLTNLSKKYGPIYSITLGNVYTVVLSDHKLVREAFAKDAFTGRAPLFLTHGLMRGFGIIGAEGSLWRDQRKLVTSFLKNFGVSKQSALREKMEKRIASGVYELLEIVDKSTGENVDLPLLISNCMGNVVNQVLYGLKFPLDDKTWKWFRQIQEEGCHELGVSGIVNFLPFIRFFSPSIQNTIQTLERGQAQTHRLYASIIHQRRKKLGLEIPKGAEYKLHESLIDEMAEGRLKCITYSKHSTNTEHYFDPNVMIGSGDNCILDYYLMEQKRRFENGDESAKFMTDEQMHFFMADLFGAGLDTTAVTLAWFILFMALHPEEQEVVRKEILSVYPEECEVDPAMLPQTMAAICETQRIRTIVPVGIPHTCLADTYIGKYKITKGTMVMPLQWAIHMNPDTWKDPETYRPSRFLAYDGSLLKPQEFILFQTGKRMCPGDEFSRMMSVGFVARLFRRKRIRLACKPPSAEEMKGITGIILSPPPVTYYCDPI